ncbi:MAG: chromate transporter [Clostridia bacterium]|nr:chromate transporter [Clostridia bacterium]
MPVLLDLFLTFLKIGAVSFGGGYAMIPMVTEEVVAKGWLTSERVMDFIAVAESTPGPIAINMATFVGATQGGILGALLATLGVVLPAFIIILLVASIIKGLLKYAPVNAFLVGVRPVVMGLIVGTGITLFLTVILGVARIGDGFSFEYKSLIIFGIVAAVSLIYNKLRKKSLSPIIIIVFAALLGMLFYGVIG